MKFSLSIIQFENVSSKRKNNLQIIQVFMRSFDFRLWEIFEGDKIREKQ